MALFVITEVLIYEKTPRMPFGVLHDKDIPRADVTMQYAAFVSAHMSWKRNSEARHENAIVATYRPQHPISLVKDRAPNGTS